MKKLLFLSIITLCTLIFSCKYQTDDSSFLEEYLKAKVTFEFLEQLNYNYSIPETVTCYNRDLHTAIDDDSSKSYLIMMYLASDSSGLEVPLVNNMIAISKGMAHSSADIKTVAFFDGYTDTTSLGKGSCLLEIQANKNCNEEIINNHYKITDNLPQWISSGEVNSGDYNILGNFISWAQENYNSDKKRITILIIGSHGFAAQGSTINAKYYNTSTSNIDEIKQINYSCCPDKTSGWSLIYTDQISQAFALGGFSSSNKIDLLIYDVCSAGTIEEAYQVKDYAKSLIFSPNLVPGAGIPYEKPVANIKPNSSIYEIGKNIVNQYASTYEKQIQNSRPVTLTFADLTLLDGVQDEINSFANYFVNNTEHASIFTDSDKMIMKYSDAISDYNLNYESSYYRTSSTYSKFYTFDLGFVTDKVLKYAENNSLTELVNICNEITNRLKKVIALSWRGKYKSSTLTTETYSDFNDSANYYGLTICGHKLGSYNPYISTFAFNSDTNWKNFLSTIYTDEF